MDGVDVGNLGRTDHRGNVEVALGELGRTDADGLVGEADVEGVAVGFAVDCDRTDAEFLAGTNDAESDFSAIGDEDFLEHLFLNQEKVLIAGSFVVGRSSFT